MSFALEFKGFSSKCIYHLSNNSNKRFLLLSVCYSGLHNIHKQHASIQYRSSQPTCINLNIHPTNVHNSKTAVDCCDSFETYAAQLQNTVDEALVLFHLLSYTDRLFHLSRIDVFGPSPLRVVYSTACGLKALCVHLKTTSNT